MTRRLVGAVDVLVVGAGPAELLLAEELTSRGMTCLLVDAHAGPEGALTTGLGDGGPKVLRGTALVGARETDGEAVVATLRTGRHDWAVLTRSVMRGDGPRRAQRRPAQAASAA